MLRNLLKAAYPIALMLWTPFTALCMDLGVFRQSVVFWLLNQTMRVWIKKKYESHFLATHTHRIAYKMKNCTMYSAVLQNSSRVFIVQSTTEEVKTDEKWSLYVYCIIMKSSGQQYAYQPSVEPWVSWEGPASRGHGGKDFFTWSGPPIWTVHNLVTSSWLSHCFR